MHLRLPWWLRLASGLGIAALGAVLAIRPTTALGVLILLSALGLIVSGLIGIVMVLQRGGTAAPWILWFGSALAGIFVLSWPGLGVRILALVVGAALLLQALATAVTAVRQRDSLDQRVATGLLGIAGIVAGVLAMSWPDVTLLVVSVGFGAWLILLGLRLAWSAIIGRVGPAAQPGLATEAAPRRNLLQRWMRTIGAVAAIAMAILGMQLSSRVHAGSPVVDGFYDYADVLPDQPGVLLRAEPLDRAVPATAQAWRILYTSTRADGRIALASGLVVTPRDGTRPFPVITWAHGTTGAAQQCAPTLAEDPFDAGAMYVLPAIVEQGWALVSADYFGLGPDGVHPYLIGVESANAVLEARRAASQLADAHLGAESVLWGHSQGGGAALWAAARAGEYAPELGITHAAALAPAAMLPELLANLPHGTGGSVFGAFAFQAYADAYADVTWNEYIRPGAEPILRAIASRCLAEPGVLVSVLEALSLHFDPELFRVDPTTGAFAARLEENVPPAAPGVQILLAQGGVDPLIAPETQRHYVAETCAAGGAIEYREYPGLDHLGLVEPESGLIPELLDWTATIFAGAGPISSCG